MGNYVIGIGGTGAKCVEAIIHLAAAGIMPRQPLNLFIVDPDDSNGNLGRTKGILTNYKKCDKLEAGKIDLFRTTVRDVENLAWSPLPRNDITLGENFTYDTMQKYNSDAAHLMDVLYSPVERKTKLSEGFRGRPSIGSAFLARTVKFQNRNDNDAPRDQNAASPWTVLKQKLENELDGAHPPQVMLVGSIFGGTGAAGIPTVGALLKKAFSDYPMDRFRLGAVDVLPYFTFEDSKDADLKAESQTFLLRAQSALRYYYEMEFAENVFDSLYVIGDHRPSEMRNTSVGGSDQKNEQHFIELYCGLACSHFFGTNSQKGCYVVSTQGNDTITWNDLPHYKSGETVKDKLGHLCRFAFAYMIAYYLVTERVSGRGAYKAPWLIDLIKKDKSIDFAVAKEDEMLSINQYCKSFLEWVANLQASVVDRDLQLFNIDAFSQKAPPKSKEIVELLKPEDFDIDRFANLVLPEQEEDLNAIHRLWNRLCRPQVKDSTAKGIGRFINALYKVCE